MRSRRILTESKARSFAQRQILICRIWEKLRFSAYVAQDDRHICVNNGTIPMGLNYNHREKPVKVGCKSRGISYIWHRKQLRRLIICLLFSFILITPAFTLIPLMIGRTFGNEVWRLTVHELVWSTAMILSGIFVSVKGKFEKKTQTIAVCIAGFGITFGLLGLSWNFVSFLVFLGLAGFFWPVLSAAQTVFVQETVPAELQGRVFSVIQIVMTGAIPIAILFFGPLADVVKIELILLVSSALLALVGVLYGLSETHMPEIVDK